MELFKLFGTIAVNNSEANQGIDETTDKAEDAAGKVKDLGDEGDRTEGKLGKAFSKMGSAAVAVGKTIATGLAVASTAVVAVGKAAISSYADYEQLVGGVETLFDESSATVIANAQNAYKTAGMSANEYMETVTSFSASLLQSLGGDTKAAADKADMAITDMSDNANKMGTSIEMIQNAYNGFAKQNYTMLDTVVVIHERVDTVYREVHLKSLVATSNAAKSKSASPKKHARQSEAISERSESDFISSALLQQAMTLPDPDSECYAANGMTVAESNYPFHMLATIPCK